MPVQEVEALAASGHPIKNLLRNCSAVQPDSDQPWPQDGRLLRRHLAIVKHTLLDWRQRVLYTLEATGFRHSDRDAAQLKSTGGAARLQLEGAYVQDVQDAQDLACACLQPESSLRAAMEVGVDCQVQLIRWGLLSDSHYMRLCSLNLMQLSYSKQAQPHWTTVLPRCSS